MDWRLEVEDNCRAVEAVVGDASHDAQAPLVAVRRLEQLRRALHRARRIASHEHGPSGFVAWWQGAAIESAWREAHRAEALVPWVVPSGELEVQLLSAGEHVRELPEGAVARTEISWLLDARRDHPTAVLTEGARGVISEALSAAHHWTNEKHVAVRELRNRLLVAAGLLVLVAVVVALLGAFRPYSVPLCQLPGQTAGASTAQAAQTQQQARQQLPVAVGTCPTGGNVPSGGDVALVELFGVLGAGLTSAASLGRTRARPSSYRLDWPQWVLQLAAGAITAFVGILVLQHSVLPGLAPLASSGQVLVYAIVFGAAQHAVTRVIDSRAQNVLAAATTKDGPDVGRPGGDEDEGAP